LLVKITARAPAGSVSCTAAIVRTNRGQPIVSPTSSFMATTRSARRTGSSGSAIAPPTSALTPIAAPSSAARTRVRPRPSQPSTSIAPAATSAGSRPAR
jgi:hypothetical protein